MYLFILSYLHCGVSKEYKNTVEVYYGEIIIKDNRKAYNYRILKNIIFKEYSTLYSNLQICNMFLSITANILLPPLYSYVRVK